VNVLVTLVSPRVKSIRIVERRRNRRKIG